MGNAVPLPLEIRSVERRRWSAGLLAAGTAGLILHGAGGTGKSTPAAQITDRVGRLEPERKTVVLRGEVSASGFLAGLAAAAGLEDGRAGLPWARRLAQLREDCPGRVPVLVVLDDFDDNLLAEPGGWVTGDPALAGLLASLAGEPLLGRLLIICRRPVQPAGGRRALARVAPPRTAVPLGGDRAGRLAPCPQPA